MKTVTIVSKGNITSRVFRDQLSDLLGKQALIRNYSCEGILPDVIDGDVTLISSLPVLEEVKSRIRDMRNVVISRRSLNYHEVYKLFSIPAGEDVLFVNDMHSSTHEAITMLRMLGIDHITFHPYYPGCADYPELPVAVTPGEWHLVPDCVRETVDIKTRVLDITTITDIVTRLGLIDTYGDMLSAHHVRDIISLMKDNAQIMLRGTHVQSQLQAIINTVHDGIVASDERGRVSVFNPVAADILDIDPAAVLDREMDGAEDLRFLIRGKNHGASRGESEFLHRVNDRHVIVTATDIHYASGETGSVYIMKDVSEIRRLEESARRKLKEANSLARYTFDDFIGMGDSLAACVDTAKRMAQSESTILLEGESGTGKELMAQSIHNASPRRLGPFIAVNFAAMTEGLLESELFGYEPGAFTGALKAGQTGLFEAAHKGTIFLDEIGDAPLPFQVKLLRVLQERQIKKVGSSRTIPIDVRVIAATNKNLRELIAHGQFRQDLYYRLNVLPLRLPPLRERREDIKHLAEHAYRRLTGKEPGDFFSRVLPVLRAYLWPGNIRELNNLVEYLIHTSPDASPHVAALPPDILENAAAGAGEDGVPGGTAGSTDCSLPDAHRVLAVIRAACDERRTVGRRSLARVTGLPESRIRIALAELVREGTIHVGKGRQGITVGPQQEREHAGERSAQ